MPSKLHNTILAKIEDAKYKDKPVKRERNMEVEEKLDIIIDLLNKIVNNGWLPPISNEIPSILSKSKEKQETMDMPVFIPNIDITGMSISTSNVQSKVTTGGDLGSAIDAMDEINWDEGDK